MADIPRLLETILSDPKIAGSRNFSSRVYSDEPILFTASRKLADFTPPEILRMRRLAQGVVFGSNETNARLFCKQGKFMESFEDDHEYLGEFVNYFPTYQSMTDEQLRGYFTWRTKVRKGRVEAASLSFAYVYVYELLNQIGVPSPLEGFRMLRAFWEEYKALDIRFKRYVPFWMREYLVYYDLDMSLADSLPRSLADVNKGMDVLFHHSDHSPEEFLAVITRYSAYDLKQSKFYRIHPGDFAEVVHRVFSAILANTAKNGKPLKNDPAHKIFGQLFEYPYIPFHSAVFHDCAEQRDRVTVLVDATYRCRNGAWTIEEFIWDSRCNRRIGDILKTIDYFMRKSRGHKSALKPGGTNKTLTAKIEAVVAQFEAEKRAVPVIEIDVAKLGGIRAASETTRDRLLVDELEEAPEEAVTEEAGTEAPSQSVPLRPAGLTESEALFLQCLLRNEPYADLLRSRGEMPSLLMDSINEKLFDTFSDTVLVEADCPAGMDVIEDYRDALKGMFAE